MDKQKHIEYMNQEVAGTLESCLNELSAPCFTSLYGLVGALDVPELSEENKVRIMMLKDWFTSFADEMTEVLGE